MAVIMAIKFGLNVLRTAASLCLHKRRLRLPTPNPPDPTHRLPSSRLPCKLIYLA